MKLFYSIFLIVLIVNYTISCKTSQGKEKKEPEKTEISKSLPQYSSEAERRFKQLDSFPESSKIFIKMTEDNRVLLNSNEISDSILKIQIKAFILEKSPEYIIGVQSHHQTKYSTYLRVQKIYTDAFIDIKNEYSINKFKSSYDLTDAVKKQIIDSLFPENIIEFEPYK